MIVVYFTPRTGSTYYAKSLAEKLGMTYGDEIFWSGPFSKNIDYDTNTGWVIPDQLQKVFDSYVGTVLNGFSQHKNSVVKINPAQLEYVAQISGFGMNLLIKKINKSADQIHFCVRENIPEQLKSTYALFSTVRGTILTDDVDLSNSHRASIMHDICHGNWTDSRHIKHDPTVLNSCTQLIHNNLTTMSSVYNYLPEHQRKLVVYEDWASSSNKYTRPMTFDNENFDVEFQLSDFFKKSRQKNDKY